MKTNVFRNIIRKKPYHLKPFWNCFPTTYAHKSLYLKVQFEVENDFYYFIGFSRDMGQSALF